MPRTRKTQAPKEEPAAEAAVHPWRAIGFVAAALVVAVVAVLYAMAGGRLFVKVEVAGAFSGPAPVVCVYPGDVADALAAGDVAVIPQAQAAVVVEPGSEVELSGRWKGAYTLAVVDSAGARDPRAGILVCQVERGETRAVFLLDSIR